MFRFVRVLVLLLSLATSSSATPRIGADLSHLPRLESCGVEYRLDGIPRDALGLFHESGYDLLRLRLWHTPTEPWHGLDSTLAFARRARDAGFEVILDLHYSDTWADPGHQSIPAAWAGLSVLELADSVRAYTNDVMHVFRDAGVTPAYVQIGNEIDSGVLWDWGRVGIEDEWDTPAQWSRFTQLLAAAGAGVRDGFPANEAPRVVLHLAAGADSGRCRRFLDRVRDAGVEFDVVGVSFYPWWHGNLSDLSANLHALAFRYGKEVQVVETSYPWTLEWVDGVSNFVGSAEQLHPGYAATPQGQRNFLADVFGVVRSVPGGLGTAVIAWEPQFLPCAGGPENPVENLTLFDFDGDALPGLRFGAAPEGPRYSEIQVVGDFNGWDAGSPPMSQVAPGTWVDTLTVAAGCHMLKFRTDGAWDVPLDFGGCAGEDAACGVPPNGRLCLVRLPGTALGKIEFPYDAEYEFRMIEADWTYAIRPLTTASVGASSTDRFRLQVAPNPLGARSEIRFGLDRRARARVTIVDTTGRLIAEVADGSFRAGSHTLVWTGRNSSGQRVAPGIYLVRLATGGAVSTCRISVLR